MAEDTNKNDGMLDPDDPFEEEIQSIFDRIKELNEVINNGKTKDETDILSE